MDTMELESSGSDSEGGSNSEGESPVMTTVQTGKPFSKEVAAVLEALYSRGMTGWGKKHSADIETAIASTGLQLTQVKNWIRWRNMKRKAAEESDTALPAKKVCLTSWQQYLKNYAKTEAGKSAMLEGPGILYKKASVAYHNLSCPEKEHLKHQVEQVMSEGKRMTKKDVIRRGEKIFVKIQKLFDELEVLGFIGFSLAFFEEKSQIVGTSSTLQCFTPQLVEHLHAVLITANPPALTTSIKPTLLESKHPPSSSASGSKHPPSSGSHSPLSSPSSGPMHPPPSSSLSGSDHPLTSSPSSALVSTSFPSSLAGPLSFSHSSSSTLAGPKDPPPPSSASSQPMYPPSSFSSSSVVDLTTTTTSSFVAPPEWVVKTIPTCGRQGETFIREMAQLPPN